MHLWIIFSTATGGMLKYQSFYLFSFVRGANRATGRETEQKREVKGRL